jgi:hypothetical protein
MKLTAALLVGLSAIAAAADKAPVAQVHTVYLLPMTNGLDQYLANRLTNLKVFQVVADPDKADAVLSDLLGEVLESRLNALFPKPAEDEADEPDEPAAKAPPAKGEKAGAEAKQPQEAERDKSLKGNTAVPVSSFRRSKGTVFLVDAHERVVLWSIYEVPKNSSSHEMDRTAERIASRLKHEIKKK